MRNEVGVDRVRLAVGHTDTAMTGSYSHQTGDDRKILQDAAEKMITD